MRLSDFHYELPEELIAQTPAIRRGDSRLLHLDGATGALVDRRFAAIVSLLRAGDLLVINDTKVMPARLFGTKASGGKVEILIERVETARKALAFVRASKTPKPGAQLLVGDTRIQVLGRRGDLFELGVGIGGADFRCLMREHGHMPLPPYIRRDDEAFDLDRYQTVYGERPGAVAAPTAGLHFDRDLLDELQRLGINLARVTLHVGAGTFQPVRAEDIGEHVMHVEWLSVDRTVCEQVVATRERGGRVVAVGTTSVRALETAAANGELSPYEGDTRLFITPGYRFHAVDALITNFHLPESTLLMLVSAFGGYSAVMRAYRHAVRERYRFFSYGDAMFIEPAVGARARES